MAVRLRQAAVEFDPRVPVRGEEFERLALSTLRNHPENLPAWAALVEVSGIQGILKEAAQAAEILSKHGSSSQRGPDTVNAVRTLSRMAVEQKEWLAAQQFLDYLAGDDGQVILSHTIDLMQLLGALYARSEDRKNHEWFCEQAIKRYKNSNDPQFLERATKMYLALPPLPDSKLLPDAVAMARRTTELIGEAHPLITFMALNRAMAEYRVGQYEEAQRWLEKSDRPQAIPFRAMVAHQLGNHGDAQEALEIAKKTLGHHASHDHLFARLSLKEARELIEGR